ncbi:hypothetical protein JYK02_39025 [Corallococcus macrosporus]|uniref:Uncharacterized protein n=1 Tax=Corallococcus macrosporus TaxID=35 RepID=A0ABS3DQA6_9BACT|nr:hypothetical protein [Corallococcus macrosporus]MBN8233531.1 hypothetical protein [Corallococcus macrosporus]
MTARTSNTKRAAGLRTRGVVMTSGTPAATFMAVASTQDIAMASGAPASTRMPTGGTRGVVTVGIALAANASTRGVPT